jgi:hypothetical protein
MPPLDVVFPGFSGGDDRRGPPGRAGESLKATSSSFQIGRDETEISSSRGGDRGGTACLKHRIRASAGALALGRRGCFVEAGQLLPVALKGLGEPAELGEHAVDRCHHGLGLADRLHWAASVDSREPKTLPDSV